MTSTNLGALTTTFTPPSSCPTGITAIETDSDMYIFQGARDTADCLPTDYVGSLNHFYSPGLDCPSGYTPACSSTAAVGDVTETAYTCCPTWLSYGCQSTTSIQYYWQSTLGCSIISDSDYPLTTSIEYVSGTYSTATSRTFEGAGGINAYSVQIRFQASDLEAATATTTTTTSSSGSGATSTAVTPSQTATASSSSLASSSTANDDGSGGLSAGAAAGIGVGCGMAGVLAMVAGVWSYRRWAQKKRQKREALELERALDEKRPDRPELGVGNETNPSEAPPFPRMDDPRYLRAELRGDKYVPMELDSRGLPVELGQEQRRYELP